MEQKLLQVGPAACYPTALEPHITSGALTCTLSGTLPGLSQGTPSFDGAMWCIGMTVSARHHAATQLHRLPHVLPAASMSITVTQHSTSRRLLELEGVMAAVASTWSWRLL